MIKILWNCRRLYDDKDELTEKCKPATDMTTPNEEACLF